MFPNRFLSLSFLLNRLRCSRILASAGALLLVVGCESLQRNEVRTPLFLVLEEPLVIPSHQAHAKFQRGRKVPGVNRYDPWCELEINAVSEQPQRIAPGRFRVGRIEQAFIRDYNTRMPVGIGGFGCDDLLFQETTFRIDRGTSSQIRYLRCFAPYAQCRFGPPLSPQQLQWVVGSGLLLTTEEGARKAKLPL